MSEYKPEDMADPRISDLVRQLDAANKRIAELESAWRDSDAEARAYVFHHKEEKDRAEVAERKLATAISNEKVYRDALNYCSPAGSFQDTVDGLRREIERRAMKAIAALQVPAIEQPQESQ